MSEEDLKYLFKGFYLCNDKDCVYGLESGYDEKRMKQIVFKYDCLKEYRRWFE